LAIQTSKLPLRREVHLAGAGVHDNQVQFDDVLRQPHDLAHLHSQPRPPRIGGGRGCRRR